MDRGLRSSLLGTYETGFLSANRAIHKTPIERGIRNDPNPRLLYTPHTGFQCNVWEFVTIREALQRRLG